MTSCAAEQLLPAQGPLLAEQPRLCCPTSACRAARRLPRSPPRLGHIPPAESQKLQLHPEDVCPEPSEAGLVSAGLRADTRGPRGSRTWAGSRRVQGQGRAVTCSLPWLLPHVQEAAPAALQWAPHPRAATVACGAIWRVNSAAEESLNGLKGILQSNDPIREQCL